MSALLSSETHLGYAWHDGLGGWRPIFGTYTPIKKGTHRGKWWVRSAGLRRRWRTDTIRLLDGTHLQRNRDPMEV